jgi:hypothetical protein
VGWVDIINGTGTWSRFQAGYGSGVIWGQGVGWVDITVGVDPVWDPTPYNNWSVALVDPASPPPPKGEGVVRGYFEWDDPPVYITIGDWGFPEE